MSKSLAWLSTVLLSCFFLACTFGIVAALDEFVRIPFYGTLPVAAGLVSGMALFLFWQRGGRAEIARSIFSTLASGARTVAEPVAAAVGDFTVEHDLGASAPHKHRYFNQSQAGEISAAVAKIHSVAWWFPPSSGRGPGDTQETMNHDAHP